MWSKADHGRASQAAEAPLKENGEVELPVLPKDPPGIFRIRPDNKYDLQTSTYRINFQGLI